MIRLVVIAALIILGHSILDIRESTGNVLVIDMPVISTKANPLQIC